MIKERLLSLPSEIEDRKLEILDERSESEDIREKLKLWELNAVEAINNATDGNGKPLHSNDSKRKVALEGAKAEDDNYLRMSEDLRLKTYRIAQLEIQLEKLLNEQGNLRAICRLGDE